MATSAAQLNTGPSARWAVLILAPALVAYLLPGVAAAMIYDRPAILAGELWRLVTGHWVHFSASHLLCDVVVIGITAWLMESRGYRYFPALCFLSALSISLVMLVSLPDMTYYGGLSGIAMAGVVYLALHGSREVQPWRGVCLGLLLLSVGKLAFDASIGDFAMIDVEDDSVRPVPLSHLTGAVSGVVVYLWSAMNRSRCSPASSNADPCTAEAQMPPDRHAAVPDMADGEVAVEGALVNKLTTDSH